jgi:hypothetical protein
MITRASCVYIARSNTKVSSSPSENITIDKKEHAVNIAKFVAKLYRLINQYKSLLRQQCVML